MSPSVAFYSGWLTVVVIVLAATMPALARLREGKRSAPLAPPMVAHANLGLAAAGCACVHTLMAVTALGSPGAIAGGMLALLPAGAAVFVLMAHVGIGLQLRRPRLRDRADKRRIHQGTALAIVVLVAAHVIGLLRGS